MIDTYNFNNPIHWNQMNHPRFYELKFMPVYAYEKELYLDQEDKIDMLSKIINYLEKSNINVTFTDRILDNIKPWEREQGKEWRHLPIAELQGNNICVNPREIDFLSVFLSIGHIYGHMVQRMDQKKYKPITDFLELPKPLDVDHLLSQYKEEYGGDYKQDFLEFEKEAFAYAKYTFQQAGIEFNEKMEYAMNVYIEADFNELWKWITTEPLKSGYTFMDEFTKLWNLPNKERYDLLPAKAINIEVIPDPEGSLIVVRDEKITS